VPGPQREDKAKLSFLLLALIAACFMTSIGYRFWREQFVVDRCLSGYYGSFDYSKMSCDLEENHPYVPYQLRHPHDKQNFLLGLSSFAVFLSVYLFLKADYQKISRP
jgi:hypothetical protein